MAFKVGDKVVYPSQGAGTIDEMTTRQVLGVEHKYLKIVFIRGDMEVLVPLKKGEEVGLRLTLGNEEVSQIMDTIERADLALPEAWPPRYRAEQDILATANPYELAKLIGVLSMRDLEKGLAATEREVFETAKDMLSSELAVVQDITLPDAKAQINTFLAEKMSISQ